MNIGFISTRLAGVDGVSLETEKLVACLREMGHACFYCAGELQREDIPGSLSPKMHFQHPEIAALTQAAFATPQIDPALRGQIYALADELRGDIERFVAQYEIDLLISQNASCIPMNIPLGLAIRDFAERSALPLVCHNHDFYWEREHFLNSGIPDILLTAFPPRGHRVQHVTINTIMQRLVKGWLGIDALLVPNVFDFANPPPAPDDYAMSFRDTLGLSADDVIVLQPTRVIRRKAIEKGIELMRKLDDPRLIYLITGYEGDDNTGYGEWLREEADRSGIRYRFIADYVDAQRGEKEGHPVYSLWDIYPHAHLITYPSAYEGFGNALIETLYFRKPLVVRQYAMYLSDIKPAGVRAVEFQQNITDEVVEATRQLIDDPAAREAMVTHNYQVGLQHFSYDVLREKLRLMLARVGDL